VEGLSRLASQLGASGVDPCNKEGTAAGLEPELHEGYYHESYVSVKVKIG